MDSMALCKVSLLSGEACKLFLPWISTVIAFLRKQSLAMPETLWQYHSYLHFYLWHATTVRICKWLQGMTPLFLWGYGEKHGTRLALRRFGEAQKTGQRGKDKKAAHVRTSFAFRDCGPLVGWPTLNVCKYVWTSKVKDLLELPEAKTANSRFPDTQEHATLGIHTLSTKLTLKTTALSFTVLKKTCNINTPKTKTAAITKCYQRELLGFWSSRQMTDNFLSKHIIYNSHLYMFLLYMMHSLEDTMAQMHMHFNMLILCILSYI